MARTKKAARGTKNPPPAEEAEVTPGSRRSLRVQQAKLQQQNLDLKQANHDLESQLARLQGGGTTATPQVGATATRRRRQQMASNARGGSVELASSDAELILRLKECTWLRGRTYRLPTWLGTDDIFGNPCSISAARRAELTDSYPAMLLDPNVNDRRFLRNWGAIWDICKQVGTKVPSSEELIPRDPTGNGSAAFQSQRRPDGLGQNENTVMALRDAFLCQKEQEKVKAQPERRSEEAHRQNDSEEARVGAATALGNAMHQDVELSTCDTDLVLRLKACAWLKGRSHTLPQWLSRTPDVHGNPSAVKEDEKPLLRKSRFVLDGNDDCKRFVRNLEVIHHIAAELKSGYPTHQDLCKPSDEVVDRPGLSYQPCAGAQLEVSNNCQGFEATDVPTVSTEPPSKTKPDIVPLKEGPVRRDPETNPDPMQQSRSSNLPWPNLSPAKLSQSSAHDAHITPEDRNRAEQLKRTVLAPLYARITKDSDEIVRLRQENKSLGAELDRRQNKAVRITEANDSEDFTSRREIEPRGVKRKPYPPSPMRLGDETNAYNDHTTEGHLAHLACKICNDLGEKLPNETIQLCGLAPLKIMDDRPDAVMQLAHQKMHTWPYSKVPTCWRRLLEDATLAKAAQMLRIRAGVLEDEAPLKKRRIASSLEQSSESSDSWFEEVVRVLDTGLSLSGAPGRSSTFEAVFQQLENHIPTEGLSSVPTRFNIVPPKPLNAFWRIGRSGSTPTFEEFQHFLNTTTTTPLIIPGVMQEWPAAKKWNNPQYLHHLTLGGTRQVPVEIGKSYTDSNWSQQLMTYRQFFQSHLIPAEPKEIGYLAQHDLFTQIPVLRSDIVVPDYCYTTPPDPKGHAAFTAGLKDAPQLQDPTLNAWLGPKGTQTPLHTDPYHNVLCQVVGYKYVRLYPPCETQKIYPRGVDEKGISLENTSEVDVSQFVPVEDLITNRRGADPAIRKEMEARFPLFQQANYIEEVLSPGESLYIPLGWWHYVESLTTSFSVSFWWN